MKGAVAFSCWKCVWIIKLVPLIPKGSLPERLMMNADRPSDNTGSHGKRRRSGVIIITAFQLW